MRLTTLFFPAVLLVCTSQIYGEQFSGIGNPTDTIWVETPDITNDTEFVNNGSIRITSAGTLTNNGTLHNAAQGAA